MTIILKCSSTCGKRHTLSITGRPCHQSIGRTFPGQVNRSWKACRDKVEKMKTIYRSQKALTSQSGAPPSDWKYFGRFDFILLGIAKASSIPSGIDQGVPKVPVEIVDLDDIPLSPKRAACLQTVVGGEPNKQYRKSQKRKREDTESVAISI
jgi:hypothetical protein